MKVKKIVFILSFLLFMIFLSGCQILTTKSKIEEVEKILSSYDNKDFDMTYYINASSENGSNTLSCRFITDTIDGEKVIYTKGYDVNGGRTHTYIFDGYLCLFDGNSEYDVVKVDDFEEEYEKPEPLEIKFSIFDINLKKEKTENEIIYTINFDDIDIKSILEDILGEDIGDFDGDMTYKVIVAKKTNELKSFEMDFLITQDENNININITGEMNAVGEEVELKIPDRVNLEIDSFIKIEAGETDNYEDITLNSNDVITFLDYEKINNTYVTERYVPITINNPSNINIEKIEVNVGYMQSITYKEFEIINLDEDNEQITLCIKEEYLKGGYITIKKIEGYYENGIIYEKDYDYDIYYIYVGLDLYVYDFNCEKELISYGEEQTYYISIVNPYGFEIQSIEFSFGTIDEFTYEGVNKIKVTYPAVDGGIVYLDKINILFDGEIYGINCNEIVHYQINE